jgi:hypothetical protein
MRGARAVLGGLIIAACYVDYAYTDGRTQPYCVLECVYMRTHSCYRCVHTLIRTDRLIRLTSRQSGYTFCNSLPIP